MPEVLGYITPERIFILDKEAIRVEKVGSLALL